MKLVFMGTPAFAVPSLEALHHSPHEVLAAVTAPDKPRGRGRKTVPSEIKKKAMEFGIPVLQPRDLRDPDFISALKGYDADVYVVIAFRILPPEVYTIPPFGALNAHASLLPKYRGAAPVHWAVYHGEKETGITVFQIERKVDTGKIILQSPTTIGAEETSGELYERLRELAAGAVLEALRKLEAGDAGFRPQDPEKATPAPKVHPGTGKLDFRQSGEQLCRAVRAFTPRPGAFFYLDGGRIKVLRAGFLRADDTRPGKISILSKKQFAIHCKDGYFLPRRLQSPGRRPMDVGDWMNGADLAKLQEAWVEIEER